MRKFYHLVSVSRTGGGYGILLDAKLLKTPLGQALLCPTEKLAQAVLQEWAGQGELIDPATMPLTEFATAVLDQIRPGRARFHREVISYLDTDLLCYHAAEPPAMTRAQQAVWLPVIAWFEKAFAARLKTTTSLHGLQQDASVHIQVEAWLQDLSDFQFCALQVVTVETGSLLLALAFLEKAATAQDVFNAAQVEDLVKAGIYQEETYGSAPETGKKHAHQVAVLQAVRRFLDALEA